MAPHFHNPGKPRRSGIAIALNIVLLALFAATQLHAHYGREAARPAIAAKEALVRELGLTDLCLFTEARYTRHLTQADLHTPFQDHPMSFDHFPSGSLLAPPGLLTHRHETRVP